MYLLNVRFSFAASVLWLIIEGGGVTRRDGNCCFTCMLLLCRGNGLGRERIEGGGLARERLRGEINIMYTVL